MPNRPYDGPEPARAARARGGAAQGRVLRVKVGYNPNSSSMGSIVYGLPLALLGAGVLFGAGAGALVALALRTAAPDAEGAALLEPAVQPEVPSAPAAVPAQSAASAAPAVPAAPAAPAADGADAPEVPQPGEGA